MPLYNRRHLYFVNSSPHRIHFDRAINRPLRRCTVRWTTSPEMLAENNSRASRSDTFRPPRDSGVHMSPLRRGVFTFSPDISAHYNAEILVRHAVPGNSAGTPRQIAVVPGEAFGAPGFIRMSYATSMRSRSREGFFASPALLQPISLHKGPHGATGRRSAGPSQIHPQRTVPALPGDLSPRSGKNSKSASTISLLIHSVVNTTATRQPGVYRIARRYGLYRPKPVSFAVMLATSYPSAVASLSGRSVEPSSETPAKRPRVRGNS